MDYSWKGLFENGQTLKTVRDSRSIAQRVIQQQGVTAWPHSDGEYDDLLPSVCHGRWGKDTSQPTATSSPDAWGLGLDCFDVHPTRQGVKCKWSDGNGVVVFKANVLFHTLANCSHSTLGDATAYLLFDDKKTLSIILNFSSILVVVCIRYTRQVDTESRSLVVRSTCDGKGVIQTVYHSVHPDTTTQSSSSLTTSLSFDESTGDAMEQSWRDAVLSIEELRKRLGSEIDVRWSFGMCCVVL